MKSLYRVIDADSWAEALKKGVVPRCQSDERADRVHLNTEESVEAVANLYFVQAEKPIALEIDPTEFSSAIYWLEPSEQKPWPQPCARISNIPLGSVVAIHGLEFDRREARFRLIRK